jgi:hypothetical protein
MTNRVADAAVEYSDVAASLLLVGLDIRAE